MASVLLLNATYEPLNVVSVRRAIVLLLKEKAEILEAAEQRIHAADFSMPKPLVIRLVYYVRVPRTLKIPLTRRTLMVRDNYRCQYCGTELSKSEMTMDHVVPKVRDGETTWENVVCACLDCNMHKGAKSLKEVNMQLLKNPTRPEYVAVVLLRRSSVKDVWNKYLPQTSAASA